MALNKSNISSDWNTIIEPPSAADGENLPLYPYNNVLVHTESGHSIECDDTPKRERIRVQHRSNTFLEMHPNGDEVHKIYGDGYEIVIKNKKVLVYGSCTIVVNGDAGIEVKGDAYTKVRKNSTISVDGNVNINCKKTVNITAGPQLQLISDSSIELVSKEVTVNGDLFVRGDIGCNQSMSCDGNMTAGQNVIANQNPIPGVPSIGLCPVTLGTHIHIDPYSGVTGIPVCFT